MSVFTVNGAKSSLRLVKDETMIGLKRKPSSRGLASRGLEQAEVRVPGIGGFEVMALDTSSRNANQQLDEARRNEDVEIGTHVYTVEGSNIPLVPNGTIIILFDIGVDELEQFDILNTFKLTLKERCDARQVIAAVTTLSPNPIKVAASMYLDNRILSAEPDLEAVPTSYEYLPPPPLGKGFMWQLQNKGFVPDAPDWPLRKGADARVVEAWQKLGNMGASNIILAVLDIGFDLTHPDLKGKVVRPFDFWNNSDELITGDPAYTHGTPCASVAIAPAVGGSGLLLGAAPNARFMPLSGTSYSLEGTRAMFEYVTQQGADIVSCSWGTADPTYAPNNLKHAAISKAAREGRKGKGCIVCFAAGNEGLDYINYYGQNPDVIVVGACTSDDTHADYSNAGPELTVVAPSNGQWPILAARPWWDQGSQDQQGAFRWFMDGKDRGAGLQHFGGTSSATPLVAGICALMLSADLNLTAAQVKQILCQTADKIGPASEYDHRGFSNKFGFGRVNALKAVTEVIRRKTGVTTPKPPTIPTPPTQPANSGTATAPVVIPALPQNTTTMPSGLFRFDVKRATSQGFGVQIGNFASYGNVLKQVEVLQARFDQPCLVHINEYKGQTVYRVIVGTFARSADAANLLTRMKNAGVNGFVQDLTKLL